MPAGKIYKITPSTSATMVSSKRRKQRKPSKGLRKAIQAVIHEDVETKQAFHQISNVLYNSGIDAPGDSVRVLPQINQGTADNSRIGDSLRAQSLILHGSIVYNPSAGQFGTYSNARIGVRVMVIQPRMFSSLDTVQASTAQWMPNLLRKGGTNTAFTGLINDLWAPINTEQIIKYYDKVFYIDAPLQSTAVGYTQLLGSTKIFKHTFKLKNRLLRYDAGANSGVSPTNYCPVFLVGYTHMDGSGADVLTTALSVSFDAIFNYEDA